MSCPGCPKCEHYALQALNEGGSPVVDRARLLDAFTEKDGRPLGPRPHTLVIPSDYPGGPEKGLRDLFAMVDEWRAGPHRSEEDRT